MDYRSQYDRLISSRQGLKRNKGEGEYYERHHIVPRCLGGGNEASNLILLTAREHFIAHRLLTKMYPSDNKLLYAVSAFQRGKRRKLKGKQLELARAATAEAVRRRNSELVASGNHVFQTEEHSEAMSKQQKQLVAEGSHNFQTEEFRKATSKRNSRLAAEGKHQFQTEEFREATSKRMSEQGKALVAEGKHQFQAAEHREAASKRCQSSKSNSSQREATTFRLMSTAKLSRSGRNNETLSLLQTAVTIGKVMNTANS